MTNKTDQPQGAPSTVHPQFVTSQFEQALETYRTQISLLIQLMTVLVLANVTVAGYAISQRISGILLIGALLPIMILYIMRFVLRLTLPIVYTAVSLEHRYGTPDGDWLASTFVATSNSAEYVDRLKAISSIQDPTERIERLRGVSRPSLGLGSDKPLAKIALVLIALGQVIAPVILSSFFNWRLF